MIADEIPEAHMTILSESEEQEHDFIKEANAVFLGTISEGTHESDVLALGGTIDRYIR